MNKYQAGAIYAFAAALCVFSTHTAALSLTDYMVITELAGDDGHVFLMKDKRRFNQ